MYVQMSRILCCPVARIQTCARDTPPRWAVWNFDILLSSYTYKGHGPPKICLWTPGVHGPPDGNHWSSHISSAVRTKETHCLRLPLKMNFVYTMKTLATDVFF